MISRAARERKEHRVTGEAPPVALPVALDTTLGSTPIALSDDIGAAKTARGNWARFIKKVFEVDPLLCPDCGGVMRIIAFIEDQRVIRAIHVHLSLWDAARPRPPQLAARGPADFEYVPCED